MQNLYESKIFEVKVLLQQTLQNLLLSRPASSSEGGGEKWGGLLWAQLHHHQEAEEICLKEEIWEMRWICWMIFLERSFDGTLEEKKRWKKAKVCLQTIS